MPVLRQESNETNSFKVFIRIRPFNEYELNMATNRDFINYIENQISVKIRNDNQTFTFDKVYHPIASQQEIFETAADDIIDNAFLGINGTIFCYGQTASGKTHTIVGDYSSELSENQGLMPRILRQVFQRKNTKISNIKQSKLDIRIKISMIEIYNEKILDLLDLNKKDLRMRENKKKGVFIENVTEKYIINAEQAMNYVKLGLQNRTVGRTNLNAYSSRSHMVFIITIHETNFQTREAKSAKITLTDLAGSEKLSKTGVEGKMLIEAKKINTSLSTLGKVIQALSEKSNHIPYRDSKLTRLLQESIGGNSLTRLIINISPSYINEYETITSLRFGSRAKLIKNKPKVNKEYTIEQLLILLEKAEMKIKQQMKIIQELQQGQTSHSNFSRRNGGFAGLGYEKSITMHMIGDDDEEYDDSSSVGSHSIVQSVASQQDNCNLSIFGDSGVFLTRTSDFEFQAPSDTKTTRKPNLCYSKSMKAIPILDLEDEHVFSESVGFSKIDSPSERKEKKFVTILDHKILNESSEDEKNNNAIKEENESCKDESLKNSTQPNFELPCKSAIKKFKEKTAKYKDEEEQEKQEKSEQQQEEAKTKKAKGKTVKLCDITNNESHMNDASLVNLASTSNRSLSKSPKDREQQKQNEMALIREEIKEQLRQQLKEHIKQQIKEELEEKIKEEFKEEIKTLNSKVETMSIQLKAAEIKFEEVRTKYDQTINVIEDQKQAIKLKDQHILDLKEKYKAKKNQINKEINKLKNFWQAGL